MTNNKLSIGIVCYPSYGGSGVVATELGLALANKGYNIHFISYETPFRLNKFHERIRFHEVDMTNYPLFKYPLYSLALTSKIVEVCESCSIDILHVHYVIPHSVCAYLARKIINGKKMKLITTLHGTDVSLVGLDKSYFRLVQFGIEESDAVTSVSEYLREKTEYEFKTKKPIEVIPNFVDLDKFSPDRKDMRLGFLNCDRRYLIHISNFREVKNISVVIKAFSHIADKLSFVDLILVGDGPDLSQAHKLARDFGIMERIHFFGKAERIESILPYVDIMLLPSKMESFGLVLLEAMSSGVVTVSSNVGGIPELVVDGSTGFMFSSDDYLGMAKECIWLLSHTEQLASFKLNARRRALDFDQNKIMLFYEDLYSRVYNS